MINQELTVSDFERAKKALEKANIDEPVVIYNGKIYREEEFNQMLRERERLNDPLTHLESEARGREQPKDTTVP